MSTELEVCMAISAPFQHRGFTLFEAIDALKAYDDGATDSGIADEDLRSAVLRYLGSLSEDELRVACAEVARGYLTDDSVRAGYGLCDVVDLAEWLEGQGIPVGG